MTEPPDSADSSLASHRPERVVCWFSCGAASAVATKLTLANFGHDNVVVAYTDTGAEHEDNKRFLRECAEWFEHPIIPLKSDKFEDTWDVWETTRYLVGPSGARCTGELKKKVRYAFERPEDRQVFGFTADRREVRRAERFREQNPGVTILTPLIERGLGKQDCLSVMDSLGIAVPTMYLLGYENNNCIGCVKGGIGYWNKIRVDFPATFWRMAHLERELNHTVLRESVNDGPPITLYDEDGQTYTHQPKKSVPLWLDELEPNRGHYPSEPSFECGPMCELAVDEIEEGAA